MIMMSSALLADQHKILFSLSFIFQFCKQVEEDSPYYDFQYNTRRARPSIVHFQVWVSSAGISNFQYNMWILNRAKAELF
jgi:hypothetical protein